MPIWQCYQIVASKDQPLYWNDPDTMALRIYLLSIWNNWKPTKGNGKSWLNNTTRFQLFVCFQLSITTDTPVATTKATKVARTVSGNRDLWGDHGELDSQNPDYSKVNRSPLGNEQLKLVKIMEFYTFWQTIYSCSRYCSFLVLTSSHFGVDNVNCATP